MIEMERKTLHFLFYTPKIAQKEEFLQKIFTKFANVKNL